MCIWSGPPSCVSSVEVENYKLYHHIQRLYIHCNCTKPFLCVHIQAQPLHAHSSKQLSSSTILHGFWDNCPRPVVASIVVYQPNWSTPWNSTMTMKCFESIIAGFPCATPSCSLGDATDGCVLCIVSEAIALVLQSVQTSGESLPCTNKCIKCHQDSYKSTTSVQHHSE